MSFPDGSISLPYAVHSNALPAIIHQVAIVCELIDFDAEANLIAAPQMRPVLRGYGLTRFPPISAYHATVCKHAADAVNQTRHPHYICIGEQ